MTKNKVVAIVQARMKSTRLPGKVLADLGGFSTLELILRRLGESELVDEIVVATSDQPADDDIVDACNSLSVKCLRGSEHDVLARFAFVAREVEADVVVRLTADCPFADPKVVDDAVELFLKGEASYVSNVITRTFPDGLDVEVFSHDLLMEADRNCHDPRFREHVTPYMRTGVYSTKDSGGNSTADLLAKADFSSLRWTLDVPEDLDFFRAILPKCGPGAGWESVLACLLKSPDLLAYNRQKKWRVGALNDFRLDKAASDTTGIGDPENASAKSNQSRYARSNELFKDVIQNIPLASQTFSKSHLQYVLGASPLFLVRGKGCVVEDVDSHQYIDYVSGLLSIILGYCDPDVDSAIMRQLEHGISFSLATPLENELAELLKRHIPCCEMVRFGKNGSDATSAAIRLARAHTGRDNVIVAGYHGWHDWYIGTTTRDLGVPEGVANLTKKVSFGDLEQVESLLRSHPNSFAALILEPSTTVPPPEGYLEGIRGLCDQFGVVLIFDEIVSGFRISLGGAQTAYGVVPDLSCFGKSMANGMPISAVVGKREYMKLMDDIFFSATFGGEALSLAAAIATINKLERLNLPSALAKHGGALIEQLNRSISDAGLTANLQYGGNNWWPRLTMKSEDIPPGTFASLLKQSLNENGLLMGSSLNLSMAHLSESISKETIVRFEAALKTLREALDSNDPRSFLQGREIIPTFAVRQ